MTRVCLSQSISPHAGLKDLQIPVTLLQCQQALVLAPTTHHIQPHLFDVSMSNITCRYSRGKSFNNVNNEVRKNTPESGSQVTRKVFLGEK